MKFTKLMMSAEDRFYHKAFDLAALIVEVLKGAGKPAPTVLDAGWRIIRAEFEKSKLQRARTLEQQEE